MTSWAWKGSAAGVRGLLLGQPRAWPVVPSCPIINNKANQAKEAICKKDVVWQSACFLKPEKVSTSRPGRDTMPQVFVTVRNQDQNRVPDF